MLHHHVDILAFALGALVGGFGRSGDTGYTGTLMLGSSTTAGGTVALTGAGSVNGAAVSFGFDASSPAGTYVLDLSGATAASGTPWRSVSVLSTAGGFTQAHAVQLGLAAPSPVDFRVGSGSFGGTAGVIQGFGKLIKTGPGTLTLNSAAASTLTGAVEIWGGTLSFGADNHLTCICNPHHGSQTGRFTGAG